MSTPRKFKTPAPEPEVAAAPEAVPEAEVFPKGRDANGLYWEDVKVEGTVYRIRQITVPESDMAWDSTTDEKSNTSNPRARLRFELCYGIVSPETTPDDIDKWSRYKLYLLMNHFDRINQLPPADAEGNGSSPVTSADTSSPVESSTAS